MADVDEIDESFWPLATIAEIRKGDLSQSIGRSSKNNIPSSRGCVNNDPTFEA